MFSSLFVLMFLFCYCVGVWVLVGVCVLVAVCDGVLVRVGV